MITEVWRSPDLPTSKLKDTVHNISQEDQWAPYWHERDERTSGNEYDKSRAISLTDGSRVLIIEEQYCDRLASCELYGTLLMQINSTGPEARQRPNAVYWRAGLAPVEGPEPRRLPNDSDPLSEQTAEWWIERLESADVHPTLAH